MASSLKQRRKQLRRAKKRRAEKKLQRPPRESPVAGVRMSEVNGHR